LIAPHAPMRRHPTGQRRRRGARVGRVAPDQAPEF